jgi:hypothetical protein
VGRRLTTAERLRRRRDSRARWREKKKPGSVGTPKGRRPLPPSERKRRRAASLKKAKRKYEERLTQTILEADDGAIFAAANGLRMANARNIDTPRITYMRSDGRLQIDDYRSAEQIITAFQRAEARRKNAPK